MTEYVWTDNPMVSGVSECNTDTVNDNLMHLKYKKADKEYVNKKIVDNIPVGTVIQSCVKPNVDVYYECNGEKIDIEDSTEIPFVPEKLKLYPLYGSSHRGEYNDYAYLYTDDINICYYDNADINHLYYFDRLNNKFRHIQENISMVKGYITSESGFFDGYYEVNTYKNSIKEKTVDMWDRKIDVKYVRNKIGFPACYEENDYTTYDKTLPGIYDRQIYSAAETDMTIAKNGYLTNVIDGKAINIGSFNNSNETWESYAITDKGLLGFTLDIDWITPSEFKAGNIFHGYRSLSLDVDENGQLKISLAGYKTSKPAFAWRHSNIATGIQLWENAKYKICIHQVGQNDFIGNTDAIHGYIVIACPYNGDGETLNYNSQQSYWIKSSYVPYNYYSNVGMNTIYHANASAFAGGFVDLYNMKISTNAENTTMSTKFSYKEMHKIEVNVQTDETGSNITNVTGLLKPTKINKLAWNPLYPSVYVVIPSPFQKISVKAGFYAPLIPPVNGMNSYIKIGE